MKEYEMIIFDIDGTLWNACDATLRAANLVANKYSELREVSLQDINSVMGLSKKEIAKKLYSYLNEEKANFYVAEIIDKAIEIINNEGATLYPNVKEAIKKLSTKYKLGIVTSNIDGYAQLFIDKSGLEGCFFDWIGTTSYGITKSEAIGLMMERNNISSACYVGDIEKDMLESLKAGADFIHARYGFDKNVKCDKHVDSVKELLSVL